MLKEEIRTSKAPRPSGAYAQGIRMGNWLFVSGQGPVDPDAGTVTASTIEEQTTQTIQNIRAILEDGGATLADVVRCTVHLSDLALFERFNAVYASFFPDPKPARTTVGSQLAGILVEIDAIACVGSWKSA